MKIFLATFFVLFGSLKGNADPFHNEWEKAGSTWFERWSEMERRAVNMTDEEKIDGFTGILGAPVGSLTEEEAAMYYRIREMLLATPGHAEYFGKQIEAIPRHPDRTFWYVYFKHLPSPETVGVLGRLLADDSARPPLAEDASNIERVLMADPNSDRAARTLQHLLANPPVPKQSDFLFKRDLETWRTWWQRVEAGNQTFRFVGDATEYDLRGPVKRSGSDDRSRGQKRPRENSSLDEKTADPENKPVRFSPYLLALVFLGAGSWYFISRKKA